MVAGDRATGESRQKEDVCVGQETQEVEPDPLPATFGGNKASGRPGGQPPPS